MKTLTSAQGVIGHLNQFARLPEFSKDISKQLLCKIEEWLSKNGYDMATADASEEIVYEGYQTVG